MHPLLKFVRVTLFHPLTPGRTRRKVLTALGNRNICDLKAYLTSPQLGGVLEACINHSHYLRMAGEKCKDASQQTFENKMRLLQK